MPLIRLSMLKYRTFLIIFFNKGIISPYFHYIKKGLVYIIIISFFSCQLSLYLKYTKTNIYLLYNILLVCFNKYIFSYYCVYFYTRYSL